MRPSPHLVIGLITITACYAGTLPFGDRLPRSLSAGSSCLVGFQAKLPDEDVNAFTAQMENAVGTFQVMVVSNFTDCRYPCISPPAPPPSPPPLPPPSPPPLPRSSRVLTALDVLSAPVSRETLPFGDRLPRNLVAGSSCLVGLQAKLQDEDVDAFVAHIENVTSQFQAVVISNFTD